MNFSTQNLHLTQSEPGKIDPMCTPDPYEEAEEATSHSESEESTQTQSTSGILISVLDI